VDATAAVDVRGLTKSYRDVHAVAGLDLSIQRGEIYALLGPNGAGKTTTVEILEGYRSRDGGTVTVLGYDPGHQRRQLKSRIGIVLQSTGVDRYLTVAETIAMYAGYYPDPRPVQEVIELVGLRPKRNTRVIKLSGGQQRRLDVAIALVGNPDLLFLDEPTTGFDPSARHEAWEVVKNLAALGKTVLLTTHYMDEAQYLADRVGVITAGRIVAEGPPATIGDRERALAHIRYRLAPGESPPPGPGRRAGTRWTCRPQSRGPDAHDAPSDWLGDRARDPAGGPGDRPAFAGGRLPGAHWHRRGHRNGRPLPRAHRRAPAVSAAALAIRQVRYVNKAFWRNPASAFFTFAFPLMFLVIFTALFGHDTVRLGSRSVNVSTYYVASMASFAVITACYNNIAITVTFQRDAGVLKRTNGTPLPGSAFLGARILHALLVSILLVAITAAFGRAFYHADIPTGLTLLRFGVMLVVGAASFCALGLVSRLRCRTRLSVPRIQLRRFRRCGPTARVNASPTTL
jgi:ABC-2 type transport system ATP-binding protein